MYYRQRITVGIICVLIMLSAIRAPALAVTIDTVPVGNSGNAGDVQLQGTFGSVGYNYRIGKFEVTNAQFVEFLNNVDPAGTNKLALYNTNMSNDPRGGITFNGGAPSGSRYTIKLGRDSNPVIFVSWYDSVRFINWLHNGQGSGNTENGAYTLVGGTPTPSNGSSITRNAGAKWWLPSEDEWYKAAYHQNDGVTGNYWDYPTATNSIPYSDQPPGTDAPDQSNAANFYYGDDMSNGYDDGYAVTGSTSLVHSQNYLTDVGAYTQSDSPYGTFDQGGNVFEWNETFVTASTRAIRGGSWLGGSAELLASIQYGGFPTTNDEDIGFRVASIPEPASIALCIAALTMLIVSRPRQSHCVSFFTFFRPETRRD